MSPGRPIVLVLAKAFPPVLGGVETYSEQIVRAYMRTGYDVIVLTQTHGAPGWTVREAAEGTFRLWNTGTGSQVRVFWRMIREARRLRRTTDVRAVHATTWRVGVVGESVFRSVPRIVTVHGREVLNFPLGARPVMRRVLRRADLVLCVSGATREIAVGAARPDNPSRFLIAHNGLTDVHSNYSDEFEDASGPVQVLALCRLVARKNVVRAVEALAMIDRKVLANVDFKIAGRGPELPKIEAAVEMHGLGDVVTLLGYVNDEDVPDLYRRADVFVHPHSHVGQGTDFEGFGIAIADAMAYRCAVVSGKDGGPSDFIVDGVTGLVVDGNDTGEIATALRRLITDPSLRRHLARAARDHARENFSWDRHVAAAGRVIEKTQGRVA